MIEGFRVDVTAEELVTHLDARVQHHRDRTQECESRLRQLQALDTEPGSEEEAFDMCASSRLHGLERVLIRHRSRELFLMFARNHVVGNEIYRLSTRTCAFWNGCRSKIRGWWWAGSDFSVVDRLAPEKQKPVALSRNGLHGNSRNAGQCVP